MTMTIILVLDDNDMSTQTIMSINGRQYANSCKYWEIECNGNIFKLYLLHIPGTNQTIEITLDNNKLHCNPEFEITISDKCLIAVSHFNTHHSNDPNNIYFKKVNYNQTPLQELPLFQADYSIAWQCIDGGHSVSATMIKSAGIENLIEDFTSQCCQYLMTLHNNLNARD